MRQKLVKMVTRRVSASGEVPKPNSTVHISTGTYQPLTAKSLRRVGSSACNS